MLKWLKQKPSIAHPTINSPITEVIVQSDDGDRRRPVAADLLLPAVNLGSKFNGTTTTDDPLATFQVQMNLGNISKGSQLKAKKSKTFSSNSNTNSKKGKKQEENEIYAVSRVNPLFEENPNSIVVNSNPNASGHAPHNDFSPGNHSGSSGYDSNTNPSENEDDTDSTQTHTSHQQPSQLFNDKDNDLVIHHEVKVIDITDQVNFGQGRSDSHSTVNEKHSPIIKKNPTYVKSITFNGGDESGSSSSDNEVNLPMTIGRALLSPSVDYSKNNSNLNFSFKNKNDSKSISKRSTRLSAIPIPIRKNSSVSNKASIDDDSFIGGVAKIVHKNSNYIQSIRICPYPGPASVSAPLHNTGIVKQLSAKLSGQIQNQKITASPTSQNQHTKDQSRRKPSVTFSDFVDVVVDNPTAAPGKEHHTSKESDPIPSSSNLRYTDQNQSKPSFNSHPSYENDNEQFSVTEDRHEHGLTTFSNSLSKNHIVKQIVSKKSFINGHSEHLVQIHANANNNSTENDVFDHDGDTEAEADFIYQAGPANISEEELDIDEEIRSDPDQSTSPVMAGGRNHLRNSSSINKSPFGGIADHYAAAKEIAKEIESYSTGTTKSTKISFVRDLLLSSHNRHGRHSVSPTKYSSAATTSSYLVTPHHLAKRGNNSGEHDEQNNDDKEDDNNNYPMIRIVDGQISVIQPFPSTSSSTKIPSGINLKKKPSWKFFRVNPQVYVKANDQQQQKNSHLKKNNKNMKNHKKLSVVETTRLNLNNKGIITDATNNHRHLNNNSNSNEDAENNAYEYAADDEGQDQVPIYEVLPRSSNRSHDDSDSGNSTDRNPIGQNKEEATIVTPHQLPKKHNIPNADGSSSSANSSPSSSRSSGNNSSSSSVSSSSDKSSIKNTSTSNNSSNKSKVMIISGDSQNMVVDLTAVPSELRTAIISGTALMTSSSKSTPDYPVGQQLEPGYTMITIPPEIRNQFSSNSNGDENDDEHLKAKYGKQNLTQIWNVMQNGGAIAEPDESGNKKKKKQVTTILPFHPNHDAHTTPDFTLEGQRLANQMKRVRNGKRRRCLCRICGMVFFLISFLGVIVTLSLVYTNGRKYFGSA